jgi:uncharacterized membrane protein YedE/YeeE
VKEKHYLGIIGIAMTILAWITLNADHFPVVYRLVAPAYFNAMTACKKIQRGNYILEKKDVGFSEISELLRILTRKKGNPEITQIRVVGGVQSPVVKQEAIQWVGYVYLEISFLNSPAEVWAVGDLQQAVKNRFLDLDIFLWGSLVFGIGIVLFAISLCIKE